MNGGDTRTPRAKVDIAKREQQIVALKLRGIPTPDIARVVGVSRQGVNKAFKKALRRQTDDALDAWHRTELGKLFIGWPLCGWEADLLRSLPGTHGYFRKPRGIATERFLNSAMPKSAEVRAVDTRRLPEGKSGPLL